MVKRASLPICLLVSLFFLSGFALARDRGNKGPEKPGVFLVDKSITQANIKVGFRGLKRPHPDYYPLSVASYIFGSGGFTSRLVAKVRSEKGLAYVVRSFVESNYYNTGTVGFYLQTKVESGGLAIRLCLKELSV